ARGGRDALEGARRARPGGQATVAGGGSVPWPGAPVFCPTLAPAPTIARVNIRNLEQIQEGDGAARSGSRLGTLLLASLGGAALVVVCVMVAKREGPAAKSTEDPLATLVAEAKQGVPAEALDGRDVTFPGILSDDETPTTALAAVKDQRGRLVKQPEEVLAPADGAEPPPAS